MSTPQRCHACGGKGKEGGCPRCGLTPRTSTVNLLSRMDLAADIIPIPYQGKIWDPPESPPTPAAREFDEKLVKVRDLFLSGKIPAFSMFIASPPKYGKHAFAYTCMQTALVQQFSVAPLLSSSDWRRLYKVSQMNPFYKLYGKYKWDDLVAMDVVFLFVDHSDDRYDSISLLKDIFDTRAAFGKPTFVLSDYKLVDLTPQWNKEAYSMIYNPDSGRDHNRYPVVMQRF